MKFLTIMISVLLIFGCVKMETNSGKQIDESQIQYIEEGKTTAAQIQQWFGKPNTYSRTNTGDIYVYLEMKTAASSVFLGKTKAQTDIKTLTINFDKTGLVTNYQFSISSSNSNMN